MYRKRKLSFVLAFLLVVQGIFTFTQFHEIDESKIIADFHHDHPQENIILTTRFAGGSGTEGDPYRISNVTHLQQMNLDLMANYTLINDINAGNTRTWNNGAGFCPVGNLSDKFLGSLEGNHHNITELFMNRSTEDLVGLFGSMDGGGKISNITFKYYNISGHRYVGLLTGNNYDATVSNISAKGSIGGGSFMGGLFGAGRGGTITDCNVGGNISGTETVGGLVGYMNGVTVRNSHTTCHVVGSSHYIGGIAGYSMDRLVVNCHSTGNIKGRDNVGGLIGISNHRVDECYTTGNIAGRDEVGGLIGDSRGWVYSCYATGNVTGEESVGGLIGDIRDPVQDSFATGNVTGTSYNVGGLIGYARERVQNCYARGNITGNTYLGGLVGFSEDEIVDSQAVGNVSGRGGAGGLIGRNEGAVTNCHAAGDVIYSYTSGGLVGENVEGTLYRSSATGEVNGPDEIGGLVGYNIRATIQNCHFAGNVSGEDRTGGLVGRNLETTLKDCYMTGNINGTGNYVSGLMGYVEDSTVENSFYCVNITKINGRNIVTSYGIYSEQFNDWLSRNKNIDIDDHMKKVQGTDYYEINTISDLRDILPFTSAGYKFRQTDDIDLADEPCFYVPLFLADEYDGNGYSISNCNISPSLCNEVGLFGKVGLGSRITRLSVLNCTVRGLRNVGGLVGYNRGTVSDCEVSGNIKGIEYVGGLIGSHQHGKVEYCCARTSVQGYYYIGGLIGVSQEIISQCYTSGSVLGNSNFIGGLVGGNGDDIRNCYSTSSVQGDDNVGGLVGDNGYSCGIWNSYSTGTVLGNERTGGLVGDNDGGVINSFWNTQTSGQIGSDGGQGRTTGQMMNENTFTTADWDFNEVWSIIGGKTYPFLKCMDYLKGIISSNNHIAYEDERFLAKFEPVCVLPEIAYGVDWNITSNTSDWLTIDESGILQGMPTNSDLGVHWVNVTASFVGESIEQAIFSFIVVNKNDAPTITTALDEIDYTADEDALYIMDFDAIDIDPTGDNLSWSFICDASFLQINSTTGELAGTPGNSDVGNWRTTVQVTDGIGGIDSITFDLTVNNTNDCPTIITIPAKSTKEDDLYLVTFNALDIDLCRDLLSWQLRTNASFLSIYDPYSGNLSGTPLNSDVGTWWANVTVNDGKGGSDSINYSLTVINTNDAPSDLSIGLMDFDYYEGRAQPAHANASDPDLRYGDHLNYTWGFNRTGNTFTGRLLKGREVNLSLPVGEHTVTLLVTDSYGLSAETTINIIIFTLDDPDLPNASDDDNDNITGDDDDDNNDNEGDNEDIDDTDNITDTEGEDSGVKSIIIVGIAATVLIIIIAVVVVVMYVLRSSKKKKAQKFEEHAEENVSGDGPPPISGSENDHSNTGMASDMSLQSHDSEGRIQNPLTPTFVPNCQNCNTPGSYYREHEAYWCDACQHWLE